MQTSQLQTIRRILQDNNAFATVLLIVALDNYGVEFLYWTPEAIEMELTDDFCEISAANFDKLMTAVSLLTSNSFFVSPTDFIKACVSLSGTFVLANHFVFPDSEDIAWGITEALLISPTEENTENPFSPEITGYVGKVLDEEGIINPPDVLKIAVRPGDVNRQVRDDYSDDPEMFSSIFQLEQSKTDSITKFVHDKALQLFTQLQGVPLVNGKTEFIGNLIRKLKTR